MSAPWTLYIGTFTKEFYYMTFDSAAMEAGEVHTVINPGGKSAFFALSEDNQYLYIADEHMGEAGGVTAYRLRKDSDPLFLNSLKTGTQGPAHVSRIRFDGRDYLLGSGYFDGEVMVFPITEDGSLLPAVEDIRLAPGAHAHGIRPIPGTPFVLATDTEHGLLYTYEMIENGRLVERSCYSDPAFQAPRHMTFSLDGKQVFVLTERTSTLEVFDIDRATGKVTHTAQFSNLPADYDNPASHSAAIHHSPDGRFVYCSNRGHDSIAAYRVENGQVFRVGWAKDSIVWPREFIITPEGNCMLVGNQEDSSVSIFALDPETGLPVYTGKQIKLPQGPICFAFVPR